MQHLNRIAKHPSVLFSSVLRDTCLPTSATALLAGSGNQSDDPAFSGLYSLGLHLAPLTVNRTRIRTAWFLLAAFVLGGVVGPTAHRLDHAAETHTVHSEDVVRNQSETVEAAVSPHASPILAVAGVSPLDCELCATRILVSDPPLIDVPVAPRRAAAIARFLPSPVRATASATVFSRGPPMGA